MRVMQLYDNTSKGRKTISRDRCRDTPAHPLLRRSMATPPIHPATWCKHNDSPAGAVRNLPGPACSSSLHVFGRF